MGRIVVGVDGSTSSAQALRWAAAQAERTGSTLDVVMSWERLNPDAWIPKDPLGTDPLAVTRASLSAFVARVLGERPPVPVVQRAMEGPAAAVLLEQAKGAELLVLGSRGHGGFAGLLLGSVSLQCVTHASCPVVVVRGTVVQHVPAVAGVGQVAEVK